MGNVEEVGEPRNKDEDERQRYEEKARDRFPHTHTHISERVKAHAPLVVAGRHLPTRHPAPTPSP